MRSLFILNGEDEKFDVEKLMTQLQAISNVHDVKDVSDVLENDALDWEYDFADDSSIFTLGKNLKTISARGLGDASLQFALELQKRSINPLRILDDGYDFHFSLDGIGSLNELKKKIREGYFDMKALELENAMQAA